MHQLERTISEQGFYVDSRLRKRDDSGHWLASQPAEYVVIDDVTLATAGRAIAHPSFSDPRNNTVFHSLAEVTRVLTQLQVAHEISISVLVTGPPNGPVLFCSLASVVCRRRL